MNNTIVPCIWLDDQAEQAADFYVRTLPAGRIVATSRYPDSTDNPGGRPRGSLLTVELELAGQRFTLLNGGPLFAPDPSISFFVHVATAGEAERIFTALAEGGEALMPLDAYPWSERYGWIQDRHGVSWQVMAGPRGPGEPVVVPCLMFSGPQHGRAEEAMNTYAGIFAGGRVQSVERYAAGQGPEGKVVHGRMMLAGQEFVAMDAHADSPITFSEGLSLQVMCKDQDEVDRYWDALAQDGEQGPCGWLKDRFGVSWQVVPADISTWLTSLDAAASDRAFQAMLQMKKLDIGELERAFRGK